MTFLRAAAAVTVSILILASCGHPDVVGEREKVWKEEAARFFAEDRDLGDLHSWLRSHNIYYTFERAEILNGQWTKGLETIHTDSFICDPWKIMLTVTVNDSDEIVEYGVSRLGTCW